METALNLLALLSLLAVIAGLVMVIIKKYRRRGWRVLGVSLVVLVASAIAAANTANKNAVTEGFLGVEDQRLANNAGYSSGEEWSEVRDEVLAAEATQRERQAEAAEEQARLEAERAEQERLEAEAAEAARQEQAAAEALAQQQQAEEDARAAEDAAQAAEDEQQARMAQKTTGMMDGVLNVLETNYGFQPPAENVCRDDGYCSLLVGSFDVSIYGNGIAEVRTSTQQPHSEYIGLCAAVFAGISGSALGFSGEAIAGAFNQAGQVGRFERDIAGVEIKVTPDLSNLLACRFYKY